MITTEELLKSAAIINPEVMEKTSSALAKIEVLDKHFCEETTKEISSITNFTIEKLSAPTIPPDFLNKVKGVGKNIVGIAAAGTALGVLNALSTELYDAAKRGLTAPGNFRRMINQNPHMKELADEKTLKQNFNLVHRYAPEFTADPSLAADIVGAVISVPANKLTFIKDLISSRKSLQDIKSNQFTPGRYDPDPFGYKHDQERIDDINREKFRDQNAAELKEREMQMRMRSERNKIGLEREKMSLEKEKMYRSTSLEKEKMRYTAAQQVASQRARAAMSNIPKMDKYRAKAKARRP